MTESVSLEHFALVNPGTTLSLSLKSGQLLGVVGLAGSGKTRFLETIQGLERQAQGSLRVNGMAVAATMGGLNRRTRPQTIARQAARTGGLTEPEILVMTGLADHRREYILNLSPAQVAAAELIEPLLSEANVVIIPGQLDRLDRVTFETVSQYILRRAAQGVCFIVETHQAQVLALCDLAVCLRQRQVVFAGTLEDLKRHAPATKITVETDYQEAVRAVVAPFEISLTTVEAGLVIKTKEGQAVTAELIKQGYGDIKLLIQREPTLDEALLALLRGSGTLSSRI